MPDTTIQAETVTLKTYCESCEMRTKHESAEQRDEYGRITETLTCSVCGNQHTVQTV